MGERDLGGDMRVVVTYVRARVEQTVFELAFIPIRNCATSKADMAQSIPISWPIARASSAVKLLPVSGTCLLLLFGGEAFGTPLDPAEHLPFHRERGRLHRNNPDLRGQGR
jgi:hypothetical protein